MMSYLKTEMDQKIKAAMLFLAVLLEPADYSYFHLKHPVAVEIPWQVEQMLTGELKKLLEPIHFSLPSYFLPVVLCLLLV